MKGVLRFLLTALIVVALFMGYIFIDGIVVDISEGDSGGVVVGVIATIFAVSFIVLCVVGLCKLNKRKPKRITQPVYEISYTVVNKKDKEPAKSSNVVYTEPPAEVLAISDGTVETTEPVQEPVPVEHTNDLIKAMDAIMPAGFASVVIVQRHTKWGYSKAARTLDQLETLGFIGPLDVSKPREILVTKEEWEKAKASGALSNAPIEPVQVEHHPILPDVEMLRNYELMTVDLMNGSDFETWCAKALIRQGFFMVTQTGKTGDHGVDITAMKDGIKYAIQCKRYSHPLGNTPIQEVYAGKNMYDCQIGVVMTNQTFTEGAIQLASKTGVLLWDRSRIIHLIRDMIVDQSESMSRI